jgi:hypothetical protein
MEAAARFHSSLVFEPRGSVTCALLLSVATCNYTMIVVRIIPYVLYIIVACMPLIRRVLGRMIGFIIRWLHTHS